MLSGYLSLPYVNALAVDPHFLHTCILYINSYAHSALSCAALLLHAMVCSSVAQMPKDLLPSFPYTHIWRHRCELCIMYVMVSRYS